MPGPILNWSNPQAMAPVVASHNVFAANASRWRRVLVGLAAILWVGVVSAQPRPDDCTISLNPLVFGNYDPLETLAPVDRTTSISVRCDRATNARIEFSTGASGSFGARTMRLGTSSLRYNVYVNAARTIVLGDGTAASVPILDRFNNGGDTITLYGRIPPGQDPTIGPHTDTIIVTMTF